MVTWILVFLSVACGVAAALAVRRARQDSLRARAAEQAAVRLMRLSARELHAAGLSLHGQAGAARLPGLGIAAAQVLAVAEALQDHAPTDVASLSLRDQAVDLPATIADAVAAASAALAPGQRNWRLPQGHAHPQVWADARALRHVIGHVLADAMRGTREQDWIDISLQPQEGGLAVVVEDEGLGLAAADSPTPAPRDTRGIGLRLTLARNLMEAHGGRLLIEATPRVGCRVTLFFPAARLRPAQLAAAPVLEPALG